MGLDLKILIQGDPKGFLESLDEIKKKSEDLNEFLSSSATKAGIAFAALSGAIVGSVVAFRDSEKVSQQLNATLKSTGFAAGLTAKQIQDMAANLQKTSTFGDEAIISGQAVLLKFRSIGSEFGNASKAMLDMAQVMGGDVPGAAQLLGKALENPVQGITLLTKQGVQFTDQQKELIKTFDETGRAAEAQAIILKQVGVAFGGSAQAASNGLGVYSQLKEVLGDIVEEVGKQFAPTFISAGKAMLEFARKIQQNEALLNTIARILAAGAGMAGFIAAVSTGALVVSKMVTAFQVLSTALGVARIAVAAFTGAATLGIGLIIAFLPEIIAFTKDMVTAFEAAKSKIITLFQNLGQNLLNIGSKIGDFLKNLFTFNLSEIKSSALALKEAVSKAIDQTFKDGIEVKSAITTKFQSDDAASKKEAEDAKKKEDALFAAGQARRAKEIEEEKKAGALKASELKRQADVEKEIEKVKSEIVVAQKNGEKTEVLKIKQEEIDLLKKLKEAQGQADISLAQANLDAFRASENERIAEALQKLDEEAIAKHNKKILNAERDKLIQQEFDNLSAADKELAQKNLATIEDDNEFLRAQAIKTNADNEVKLKQEANKKKLDDEIKYGKTYAQINEVLNSSAVKGTQQATSELTALQSSKNETLKNIGKTAAITQIGIDTAKSAMSIYAGFAALGPFGIPLGIAGAAAAVAFGAEKASAVRAARTGGIVPGVGSGDIVPMMLEPGETIVPKALTPTFQQQFSGLTPDASSPARGASFTFGSIIGTEEFVKGQLIPAIKDAVQLDNANLGVA